MLDQREWLEADGLGGFASGTVSGVRTRRYHAWLLTATHPPAGRLVLVNGFEGDVITPGGRYSLSTQRYAPDVVHPHGWQYLTNFALAPWPTWTYKFPDGTGIRMELFVPHESAAVIVRWSLHEGLNRSVRLSIRPLFSGRDYHALHHENAAVRVEPAPLPQGWRWQLYDGIPAISIFSNARYIHAPLWYRNFQYLQEQDRGLDFQEDLVAPGEFQFDLATQPAVCLLTAAVPGSLIPRSDQTLLEQVSHWESAERDRRNRFPNRLHRAADAYIVTRGTGRTIMAGYPWFTDWGRDTFIALRGLSLSTGRLAAAQQILTDWAGTISEGMLPNRFPDYGEQPEYNSVDAALWFIITVHDYLQTRERRREVVPSSERKRLIAAVEQILQSYCNGTRYGIQVDRDGLLRAGQPGVQLTWMDAKVGDWIVTPRSGKPVEIQALWINALWIASQWSSLWEARFETARRSFVQRFWNEPAQGLFDVVDVDHHAGQNDASIRPNQIFAVGGLPLVLLDATQAAAVVQQVQERLWTPLGLRTLDPRDAKYQPHYHGGVWERDGAYHQGTVWPWLLGSFIEAWIRVGGNTPTRRQAARERFLQPVLNHLEEFGLGHVCEVADGSPGADGQQFCGGCPFQAWSLGELLRLQAVLEE